jgi:hypothetical protein
MYHTETVEVRGHIFDSGLIARIIGHIVEYGGDYRIERLEPGYGPGDESVARVGWLSARTTRSS